MSTNCEHTIFVDMPMHKHERTLTPERNNRCAICGKCMNIIYPFNEGPYLQRQSFSFIQRMDAYRIDILKGDPCKQIL